MVSADSARASDRMSRETKLSVWLTTLLGAVSFGSIPFIVLVLKGSESLFSDIIFPLILIAGLVSLISAISLLVFLLRSLELHDRRFALGMPDGTIRAIIAVMLILLFAMLAVFLYIDLAGGSQTTLRGISREALDAIPATQLLEVTESEDATERFDVTTRVERPQASADVAKQLVTTVSTLVVAISAFYFGAQSAETARRRRDPAEQREPTDAASGAAPRPVP